ncbi:putative P-loop containing nucleoside triphosphate hydrolase, leucine-rich repeat domain, L [Medicago truncatula]|uniref:LRR and NB-ARC domain disease resistance protein, putative n=1 Tax=Medicago truncatula TaxID=3880 RepID=G7KAX4_MEDTR|nr:LRR and NB-ARC domain disease resistance protein, putative [Medicago truncatula]RHN54760.1 putative P-loop containing nucleoside triphosphate hydrolase, leucine-rich repeat domain, L [Medicago truncatula]
MVAYSISSILQLISTLKPIPTRLSGIDHINKLEDILKEINDKVQKLSYSSIGEVRLLPLLQKVRDVVIDLNDLMEVLRYNESTTSGSTTAFIAFGLKITNHFKVKKAAEEFKRLIEVDLKGLCLSISQEAAEAATETVNSNMKNVKRNFEKITMVGRENEKKEIIDQLLKLNNPADDFVPVIVIVGVPGIGKTKLASLVCEDEQVKAHFGFEPIWIRSLHETFDVEYIANLAMTTVIDGSVRRLLVLDDLRIEIKHDLEKLQKKLTESGGTSWAILITTRSNYVADNISVARYVLKGLNRHESQLLFQQIRGQTSTSTNNKQDNIEWELVKDCGGVPLAIVTVAMLMKNQSAGGVSILAADQIAEVERKFLQELKFMYYKDLPMLHKLCFAYCSLFPRDYLIDAERLIELWTAEGFLTIPQQQFCRPCFNDFVPLVFQQVEEKEEGVVSNHSYRMNRLMHKLARLVTCEENMTVNSMGDKVKGGMLRASFDFALDLSCGIPDLLFDKAKKLRTILLPYSTNNPRLPHEVKMTTSTCDKIFNTFKSLRVLDLHDLGIKMVPTSIEEVKYLRYLDLSHNNIEKLPSSITKLIHLQTLKLSQCHILKELPKDLDGLSCLNHLDIEGCLDLTHMPSGINKLTSLQTLSLFVASKKQVITGGLRELTDLNNLRGRLEISHLEQVMFSPSKEAAQDEFLKNKQHLEFLTLRWDHDDEEEEEEEKVSHVKDIDRKLLDCLEPHPNLRALFIVGYNRHTLSNWLHSIQCLVKFTLNDCPKCEFLPPMDQLPHLKVLQIRRLDSLKFIAENNQVGNSPSSTTPILFFPSLKELTISDCPNLKSWWENEIWGNDRPYFSCISKLNIQCCPKLACMPLYPGLDDELVLVESNVRSMRDTMHHADGSETTTKSKPFSKLKSMVIERIEQTPPERWLKNFVSLEELHIRDCVILKSLPQGFKSLSSLISLTIERCEELDLDISGTEWKGLRKLRSLTLRSIPKLKSLPREIENLNSLHDLRLYDCHGLTDLTESIGNLTSLGKLVISECRNLDYLPKGMEMLQSLNTLIIMDCPLLLPRCQPDTGDDWPQIAHIKNKLVKKTPQDLRDDM